MKIRNYNLIISFILFSLTSTFSQKVFNIGRMDYVEDLYGEFFLRKERNKFRAHDINFVSNWCSTLGDFRFKITERDDGLYRPPDEKIARFYDRSNFPRLRPRDYKRLLKGREYVYRPRFSYSGYYNVITMYSPDFIVILTFDSLSHVESIDRDRFLRGVQFFNIYYVKTGNRYFMRLARKTSWDSTVNGALAFKQDTISVGLSLGLGGKFHIKDYQPVRSNLDSIVKYHLDPIHHYRAKKLRNGKYILVDIWGRRVLRRSYERIIVGSHKIFLKREGKFSALNSKLEPI